TGFSRFEDGARAQRDRAFGTSRAHSFSTFLHLQLSSFAGLIFFSIDKNQTRVNARACFTLVLTSLLDRFRHTSIKTSRAYYSPIPIVNRISSNFWPSWIGGCRT